MLRQEADADATAHSNVGQFRCRTGVVSNLPTHHNPTSASAASPARARSRSSPGEHSRGGWEAKSLEDLANTIHPVVAQRGVPDIAKLHARQPLGICVKLREESRDIRRVEG